jgi:hypothetical protein
MKHSFEFELKNFNKIFNQYKEIQGIESTNYQYGAYKWSLQTYINKYKFQENGDLWLIISLSCESDDKINFPLFARMTKI